MRKIWYLPGPFYRYEQDVKALAREARVVIIDSNVTDDRTDAAEVVPEVSLKPEYRPKQAESVLQPQDVPTANAQAEEEKTSEPKPRKPKAE